MVPDYAQKKCLMLEPTLVYAFGVGTFAAFSVLAVLLIMNCGLCGRSSEYEALLDKRPISNQPLVTKHQILTAAKKQWEKEDIVENVLYFVRSLPDCKLHADHNLWTMAWRDTRANFLVDFQGKVRMNDACPLPWNKAGKDALVTSLRELKHPFIQLCSEADILFDDKQIVTLTLFGNSGSLRDEIFNCEPTEDWERKYNPKRGKKISTSNISKYGRQILEALLFLEKSGFPYTHLHTGNVIVKGGVARITQLENGLLNLERQHERLLRQFYKQLPKKFAENNLNVITFGILLYECAVGKILENLSQIAEYPATSPAQAKTILDSIFTEGSAKAPTIEELLNNDFFKVNLNNYERPAPVVFNKQIQQILNKANEASSQLFGVFKPTPKVKKPRRTVTSTRGSAQSTPTSPRASSQAPSPTTTTPTTVRATTTTTTTSPPPAAKPAPVASPVASPPPVRAAGPPPPAGGPPGGPPGPPPNLAAAQPGRSSLLSSIEGFKGGLKKVKTVDKSAPLAGRVVG